MNPENAKKIIIDIFNHLGLATESVEYSFNEKRGHVFTVKSAEFGKIAAEKVDLPKDMVYLLKRLFNKSALPGEELFKCTIDINDMQSKADDVVKNKALAAADEARNLKTDVTMEPMSSYDRMVVHSTLAGMSDISTESVGVGKERRLKVKYLAI